MAKAVVKHAVVLIVVTNKITDQPAKFYQKAHFKEEVGANVKSRIALRNTALVGMTKRNARLAFANALSVIIPLKIKRKKRMLNKCSTIKYKMY